MKTYKIPKTFKLDGKIIEIPWVEMQDAKGFEAVIKTDHRPEEIEDFYYYSSLDEYKIDINGFIDKWLHPNGDLVLEFKI